MATHKGMKFTKILSDALTSLSKFKLEFVPNADPTRQVARIFKSDGITLCPLRVGEPDPALPPATRATFAATRAAVDAAVLPFAGLSERSRLFITPIIEQWLNPRAIITHFSDKGGGLVGVECSTAHLLKDGYQVTISGTTHYDGTYTITKDGGNAFIIEAAWDSDDATGSIAKWFKIGDRCFALDTTWKFYIATTENADDPVAGVGWTLMTDDERQEYSFGPVLTGGTIINLIKAMTFAASNADAGTAHFTLLARKTGESDVTIMDDTLDLWTPGDQADNPAIQVLSEFGDGWALIAKFNQGTITGVPASSGMAAAEIFLSSPGIYGLIPS